MNAGYKKLYKQIFNDRCKEDFEGGRYMDCIDCGKRIYEQQVVVHNFAHIESKGSNPKEKLNPDNIAFKCAKCHIEEHISGESKDQLPIN